MKFTFGELLQCRPAAGPVLPLGVDDVEGHPVGDHHWVPRGRETEQQPGFFLAFFWRDADSHGRLRDVFLWLLWNRQQFHGFFVVGAQAFYLGVGECEGRLFLLSPAGMVLQQARGQGEASP
ncbi:hypothetical protein [Streptomyces sp. NPDC059916]|uniref:hypothetical protein n=1 Tax=Streptomyces sp. NPDC059916 TaxID=3347001 RepID=UPI0036C27E1B